MDCSPPGSSVQGILQVRIWEWVAMPFSRGSPWPRDWIQVSCIAGRFFTIWATSLLLISLWLQREDPLGKEPMDLLLLILRQVCRSQPFSTGWYKHRESLRWKNAPTHSHGASWGWGCQATHEVIKRLTQCFPTHSQHPQLSKDISISTRLEPTPRMPNGELWANVLRELWTFDSQEPGGWKSGATQKKAGRGGRKDVLSGQGRYSSASDNDSPCNYMKWKEDSMSAYAAAAAKSLQLCPTLCDPIDGSLPGSSIPGIFQVRTLEWVAISFSSAWKWKVKSLSHVQLFMTPWTAAYQAPPSMGFSRQEYWSAVPLPSPMPAYEISCKNSTAKLKNKQTNTIYSSVSSWYVLYSSDLQIQNM